MAKNTGYQSQIDDSSTEEDLIKKMRARRLAEMLNRDAQAPIDYDPRGAISSSQLMAKALANAGSMFANQQQDREQARGMIAQNRQEQEMFADDGGFGGNPLAGNMTGAQARYLRATNPEKWAEMVANNQKYTDPMKNANAAWKSDAGRYMQLDQNAELTKKQGDAAKAGLMDVSPEHTLFDAQMNKPLFTANKLYEQDLGNRRNITAVNAGTGQSNVIRTDNVGIDPNRYGGGSSGGTGRDMSDQEALTHALGIMAQGKEYTGTQQGRGLHPKVGSMQARLMQGETPESIVKGFNSDGVGQNQSDALAKQQRALSSKSGVKYWLGGGKGSGLLTNAETVGRHVREVEELIGGLSTGDITVFNKIGNAYGRQVGDEPLAAYSAAIELAAPELSRLVVGGQNALKDREDTKAIFDPAAPESAKRAALATIKNMAYDRFLSYGNQFKRDTGQNDDNEFISVIGDPYTRQLYGDAVKRNNDIYSHSKSSNADGFSTTKSGKKYRVE